MFNFVPIASYTPIFNYTVLLLMVIVLFQCHTGSVLQRNTASMNAGWGVLIMIVLVLYMGLRPISSVFGDTMNYAREFVVQQKSNAPFTWKIKSEWLFDNVMQLFAKYGSLHSFFLFCSICYVVPLWHAMQRIFSTYYFVPFLVILSTFFFWQYGVNGIRNGIGASFFILALTYVENLPVAIALCLIGVGFHQSVFLMIGAAVVTWFFNKSNYYLAAWAICVVVSYFGGDLIQSHLSGLSVFSGDDRFANYLTGEATKGEGVEVSMSFRWDCLIFSAVGVVAGYYFIFRREFEDEYYHWIYNTFLATNAFWVLIIRAAYSNRFAQISWFIMPLVLIYPFMKKRFWQDHEKMLGYGLMAFYVFTFYFNIVRGG